MTHAVVLAGFFLLTTNNETEYNTVVVNNE